MKLDRRLAAILALSWGFSACSLPKPDAQDLAARKVLHDLEAADSASLASVLGPELASMTAYEALRAIGDSLRVLAPDSVELVGYRVTQMSGQSVALLTYELRGRAVALANVRVEGRDDRFAVSAIRLARQDESLAMANAFTLSGKTVEHYLVLIVAVLCAAFSIGTAVLVACTKMPRRWLWAFVALIGAGVFTLNWTSGERAFNALRFNLFSAAAMRPGHVGPWLISFALPVGAVVALLRRRAVLARGAASAGTSRKPPTSP